MEPVVEIPLHESSPILQHGIPTQPCTRRAVIAIGKGRRRSVLVLAAVSVLLAVGLAITTWRRTSQRPGVPGVGALGLPTGGARRSGSEVEFFSVEEHVDARMHMNTNSNTPNYTAVFPEEDSRPGRLSHNHRTVTLGGFSRLELNARYTERFGLEYVVGGRETYWKADLAYFLYWCTFSKQWIVGFNFKTVTENRCDFTAKGPVGIDILDPLRPVGSWSEWKDGALVDAPRAGVDIVSTQEWLAGDKGSRGQYDSLDTFPECKRPPFTGINFTRVYKDLLTQREELTSNTNYNQGTCRNCWAITVVELVARLLCITSDRQWAGPRALLSPAYLTSCARPALITPEDGCQGGGRPLEALWWIGTNGLPTGGSSWSDQTCVPFFKANHTEATHAPPCPTSCTNPKYPRTLQEDLFIPEGLRYSYQTTALESALKAIQSGPIGIVIPLYEDFYNYTGGVYEHRTGRRLGNHVMVAHGYKDGYINGFNSWGPGWGYFGNYRLGQEFPIAFIIPGKISGNGKGYPYPFPQSTTHVTMGGFGTAHLNGVFTLWLHELAEINGHPTFWKGNHHVLYWCSVSSYWALANVSLLGVSDDEMWQDGWRTTVARSAAKVRDRLSTRCSWLAHGPQLLTYEAIPTMADVHLRGWFEQQGTGLPLLKPLAGIQSRN